MLNVRQMPDNGNGLAEMVYQTDRDIFDAKLSVPPAMRIAFQFRAPRRSCRLNIQLSAFVASNNGNYG